MFRQLEAMTLELRSLENVHATGAGLREYHWSGICPCEMQIVLIFSCRWLMASCMELAIMMRRADSGLLGTIGPHEIPAT
ncbi:hypothetical protein EAH_00068500 [Eimeria acervulina]|uniref:Uncharacterized protein n=1 Tax=Eimeria acervulina TaxID=5801 RepID=U6GV16_EIMAC|nr:hypothetical protein EAH_00068500 [Eimeria acervulina]CDI83128.1 hypothetical protein EAH_00068500 [Eimeria acervulina]